MSDLHISALLALRDVGFRLNLRERKLSGGGGEAHQLRSSEGDVWVKLHARSHEQDRRYWVGINISAVDQVDFFAFWLEREPRLYFVPAGYLREIIAEQGPRGYVTVRGRQWHTDIYARSNALALPKVFCRYDLGDYAIDIPGAGMAGEETACANRRIC